MGELTFATAATLACTEESHQKFCLRGERQNPGQLASEVAQKTWQLHKESKEFQRNTRL